MFGAEPGESRLGDAGVAEDIGKVIAREARPLALCLGVCSGVLAPGALIDNFFRGTIMRHLPLLSAGLLVVAIGLTWNHLRKWRIWQSRPMDAAERDYRTGQFRRRTHAASLLAVIGVGMFIGYWIEPKQHPRLFASIWMGVLLITLWMIGVAIFDAIETGRYFSRISRRR